MSREPPNHSGDVARVAKFLLLFAYLLAWQAGASSADPRRFRVEDAIELNTFSSRNPESPQEVKYSPDRKRLLAVTFRGLLPAGRNEASVWCFDLPTAAGTAPGTWLPRPRLLARMSSPASGDPISDVRWSTDGQRVMFLGRENSYSRALYSVDLGTGTTRRLTPDGQDVSNYDVADVSIVYAVSPDSSPAALYRAVRPDVPDEVHGPGLPLTGLVFPSLIESPAVFNTVRNQLWQVRDGKASPIVERATGTAISLLPRGGAVSGMLSVSASGRYAVITRYAPAIPRSWEGYRSAYPSDSWYSLRADPVSSNPGDSSNLLRAQEVFLADLQSHDVSVLIDGPLAHSLGYFTSAKPIWSPDSKSVIVPNVFLPLIGDGRQVRERQARPCIAQVSIETRRVKCIKPIRPPDAKARIHESETLDSMSWGESNHELVLHLTTFPDGIERTETLQEVGSSWLIVHREPTKDADVLQHVTISEAPNQPPVLAVEDSTGRMVRKIWDPNPQLASINLGNVEVLHWRDPHGREWTGGLVLPPGFSDKRRDPLVIQTHGFGLHKFLVDGFYSTGMAARALAARDILVLQVNEPRDRLGKPGDSELNGVAGYEAAIKLLAHRGIVDTNKVGIIGFSHYGQAVLDALIWHPKLFAVATLPEGGGGTFWQYLMNVDYQSPARVEVEIEQMGAAPYGPGFQKWIKDSPGFHTDRIHAPILFQWNSADELIWSWDVYALLRAQQKPVDLLYFRGGTHVMNNPKEMEVSQQTAVDWFDFWLNGHEDPDLHKTEQYRRWESLCDTQISQNPHQAAFCVRTKKGE